jgi:hypothetical protein
MFKIFIDDVTGCTSEGNRRYPCIGTRLIPDMLFEDDLAFGSLTVNGLQKGIVKVVKYFNQWNLKCNISKTKILVLRWGKTEKERKMVYV